MLMPVMLRLSCVGMLLGSVVPVMAQQQTALKMEVTAYCPCGKCNEYHRGSWKFLKLDQWNRYSDSGGRYTGKSAAGEKLVEPRAGLLSGETIHKPWTVPGKVILPWRAKKRLGTIAADTDYYPFGTMMYVPGWGWGVVSDRGGDIKGPQRIDIFFSSHGETTSWGRQNLNVTVQDARQ